MTKQRRVLLVDDHEPSAQALARLLRVHGHEVRVTADGKTALECVSEYLPDLILLDIGLPVLDGYQVARLLRAHPASADVTLVALTGYASTADRVRAHNAGFNLHLAKPVSAQSILAVVDLPATAPGAR